MTNITVLVAGQSQPSVIQTYPFYAFIEPDYVRTSDHFPRTHGKYPTTASIDYIHMKDYYANIGMPDQFNLYDDLRFELKSAHQWLWMDVNCISRYGKRFSALLSAQKKEAKLQWRSLTDGGRCFTNGTSWNNGYRDWVQPLNIFATKGIQQEQIVCSMNFVKVIGAPVIKYSNYLGLGNKALLHYPIECLDPNRALPTPEALIEKFWMCHNPSNSTGQYIGNGEYQITRFPQFNEQSKYISWGKNGIGWIRADWVTKT